MNQLGIQNRSFTIDGQPVELQSGSMHYFRIHPGDWGKRLDLAVDFGLNAIQTYVPWNLHEPEKGVFDFEGMLDLSVFLKLAQEKGLYVLLRPAPYICSEWDFGGLPSRLLKDRDMTIRTSDPTYLKEVADYYRALCPQFVPHLATNGGCVIAVCIENEYGSYGADHAYIDAIAALLQQNGVDVPFYTTDGDLPTMIHYGRHGDDFTGMNYRARQGTSQHAYDMTTLNDPDKPFFVGEFWAGRSMHWGEPFHRRDPRETSEGYREALELGGNVNFYMFSGGSNFGYMGGANHGNSFSPRPGTPARYIPHTTSYDVDALIHEDGTVGEKYFLCRDVLDAHRGKPARPHIAPEHRTQSVIVPLTEKADFFENLAALTVREIDAPLPKTMEQFDQSYGAVVYELAIDGYRDDPRPLNIEGVKDRATVYANGEYLATYMRDRGVTVADGAKTSGSLPLIEMNGQPTHLTILAENLGRINFGWKMTEERKGIDGRVIFGWLTLFGCKSRSIDLDRRASLPYAENAESAFRPMQPLFLKGTFDADPSADAYVDFSSFGHGYVFINGFNLGRFDSVGPVETLYLPAGLLKEKDNLIEVADFAPTRFNSEIRLLDHSVMEGDAAELH